MHPTLGTQLYNLLFEQITDTDSFKATLDAGIRDAVETWLPYINIDSLEFNLVPDNNLVELSIVFSLKTDPTIQEKLYISVSGGEL